MSVNQTASFLTRSLIQALPNQEDSLFAPQSQRDLQIAYAAARQLIDGLEWRWVAITWISIPNHRPRPLLYALPPKTLKTPSDENLMIPIPGLSKAQPIDPTTELPRPEWIFPCYASEKTNLPFWGALFDALPKDTLPLLADLKLELPVGNEPFNYMVQLIPDPTQTIIEVPSEISVPPIRQILTASMSLEGAFSFAVVREGFINRSATSRIDNNN